MVFIGEVVTVERAPGRGLVFQHGHFGATTPLPVAPVAPKSKT
jgi:hypothetical protein